MKEQKNFPLWESWGKGYGSFTCSFREKDQIISYIKNQKSHHQKESFVDEYKRLLKENGIEFDERYLLG
ncbi:putative transposase [Cyclobacterium qasimii M12-11B]|nr:putative transposase [Cyclobacterium qasimii M12-11B]